jgi:hypothetical protein
LTVRKKARVRDTTYRNCRESEHEPDMFEVRINWRREHKRERQDKSECQQVKSRHVQSKLQTEIYEPNLYAAQDATR